MSLGSETPSPTDRSRPAAAGRVAIVGAGPTGVSFLERLGANVADLLGDLPLEVHLVDPYPPGAGRIWRDSQSALLWMNSMAQDVTMYTDDTVTCEGPIRPGPTLVEWATQVSPSGLATPELTEEVRALSGTTFPTRRIQSAYLAAVYQEVVRRLPPTVTLVAHTGQVVDIDQFDDGTQELILDSGARLPADVVVLTLGHLDLDGDGEQRRLEEFARRNSLAYLPPDFQADADLSGFTAGSPVILRGMGLAAVDAIVLLTEGRGGRYSEADDGTLTYHPSGQEPHLMAGSRRGVPYHGKLVYPLQGPRPQLPRFLSTAAIDDLLASHERVDFRTHVWPLLSKELAWAYYHELFHAHPERTALGWEEFEASFAGLSGDSPELAALVQAAVPSADDRLEFEAYDRPLRGVRFDDHADLQEHVRAYIEADLRRRADPEFSADLGTFNALLVAFAQLARIMASGKLDLVSRRDDVDGWWRSFFSYYASGPPAERLRQWLALSRAEVLDFLGADMWVEPGSDGRFRAGGSNTPEVVEADGLIEARNPGPSVSRNRNELIRRLHQRGEIVEEELNDASTGVSYNTGRICVTAHGLRLIDQTGAAHPRRVALGYPTSRPAAGTFSRPRTNAASFRQNDAVARSVLATLALVVPGELGGSAARHQKATTG